MKPQVFITGISINIFQVNLVKEIRCGEFNMMMLSIKVNLRIIKNMVQELVGIQQDKYIRVVGITAKGMAKVLLLSLMVHNLKEFGLKDKEKVKDTYRIII